MINLLQKFISHLVIISALASCTSTVHTQAIENDTEGMRILFVNMKITRDKSGMDVIELVSKKWTSGEIQEPSQAIMPKGELLVCEFLDKDKKVLSSVTVQNPLKASVEEYSPDGSIKRAEPKLEMSYFSVRSSVSSRTVQLQVSSEDGKVIGTFNLQ